MAANGIFGALLREPSAQATLLSRELAIMKMWHPTTLPIIILVLSFSLILISALRQKVAGSDGWARNMAKAASAACFEKRESCNSTTQPKQALVARLPEAEEAPLEV